MINNYSGHHIFNALSVSTHAPGLIGIYYCGYVNLSNALVTHYVGRAMGEGVTIRKRLQDHLSEGWRDVTHFGFCVCTTQKEAEYFEKAEIARLNPKYNKIGRFPSGW